MSSLQQILLLLVILLLNHFDKVAAWLIVPAQLSSKQGFAAPSVISTRLKASGSSSNLPFPTMNATDVPPTCPFARFPRHRKRQETTTTTSTKLKTVRSIPYFGSLIHRLSGIPKPNRKQYYTFFPQMRQRFGDFYRFGNPMLSDYDSHGSVYVVTDPDHMHKIFRQEGKVPSGVLERLWFGPIGHKAIQSPLVDVDSDDGGDDDHGPFGHSPRWSVFAQYFRDILATTRGPAFFSNMATIAQQSSQPAADRHWRGNAKDFVNCFIIDMYMASFYGEQVHATRTTGTQNNKYDSKTMACKAASILQMAAHMTASPWQRFVGKTLRLKSRYGRRGIKILKHVVDSTKTRFDDLHVKYDNGQLTELERACSAVRSIEIQKKGRLGLTEQEMQDMCVFSLAPAIDTTSAYLSWILIHLALNQGTQARLRAELMSNMERFGGGGKLSEDSSIIDPSNAPFLHAVLRETHRITPVFSLPFQKQNKLQAVEVDGHLIPKGSTVILDFYSKGMDADILKDDPAQFRPERWLPDEVSNRKGTAAEVLDSTLYYSPYWYGKRKCPGADAANKMLLIAVSQLVLDWELRPTVTSLNDVTYEQKGSIAPDFLPIQFSPLK